MLTFKGEILIAPHEKLRRRVDEIAPDKVDSTFLQLMKEVIEEKQAAGLAANQIGFNRRVIMFREGERWHWFINPKIRDFSEGINYDWEGCLSIPGKAYMVPRWDWVTMTDSVDPDHPHVFTGFMAKVVQHEIDHLNGILISDISVRELEQC